MCAGCRPREAATACRRWTIRSSATWWPCTRARRCRVAIARSSPPTVTRRTRSCGPTCGRPSGRSPCRCTTASRAAWPTSSRPSSPSGRAPACKVLLPAATRSARGRCEEHVRRGAACRRRRGGHLPADALVRAAQGAAPLAHPRRRGRRQRRLHGRLRAGRQVARRRAPRGPVARHERALRGPGGDAAAGARSPPAWAEATGSCSPATCSSRRRTARPARRRRSCTRGLLHAVADPRQHAGRAVHGADIAGARRRLYVTNSYFVPDDDFCGLLAAAAQARRGRAHAHVQREDRREVDVLRGPRDATRSCSAPACASSSTSRR